MQSNIWGPGRVPMCNSTAAKMSFSTREYTNAFRDALEIWSLLFQICSTAIWDKNKLRNHRLFNNTKSIRHFRTIINQ